MPQLDYTLLFHQIFWLFLIFTNLYFIFVHYFAPNLLKVFKVRKQISTQIFDECQTINKHIQKITFFYKRKTRDCLKISQLLYSTATFFKDCEKNVLKSNLISKTIISIISNYILYIKVLK